MTTLPSHLDDDHHIPDLLGTCSNWGLFINYVLFFYFSTINFMIVYLYH